MTTGSHHYSYCKYCKTILWVCACLPTGTGNLPPKKSSFLKRQRPHHPGFHWRRQKTYHRLGTGAKSHGVQRRHLDLSWSSKKEITGEMTVEWDLEWEGRFFPRWVGISERLNHVSKAEDTGVNGPFTRKRCLVMLGENTASFTHANRKTSKHFKWLRVDLTFYAFNPLSWDCGARQGRGLVLPILMQRLRDERKMYNWLSFLKFIIPGIQLHEYTFAQHKHRMCLSYWETDLMGHTASLPIWQFGGIWRTCLSHFDSVKY